MPNYERFQLIITYKYRYVIYHVLLLHPVQNGGMWLSCAIQFNILSEIGT